MSGLSSAGTLTSSPATRSATGVLRVVVTIFGLNLLLVLACLPVVTAPAACRAALVALDRWRRGEEQRAVREFVTVLRSRPLLAAALPAGGLVAVAAVAAEEVHYFSRGFTVVGSCCLGLGAAALLLSLMSIGYCLVLGARRPELPASAVWSSSLLLAVRNLFWTSPLLLGELVVGLLVLLRDPPLALVGLPLAVLGAVGFTADLGIRRVDRVAARRARSAAVGADG